MFVVYHIRSTMLVGPTKNGHPHTAYAHTYKTAHMAKRACENFNKKDNTDWTGSKLIGPGHYGWCDADHYQSKVVHMIERTNLRSGKKYIEPSNTPSYMSPSSEAYWSM
jgi:hypothetical protein